MALDEWIVDKEKYISKMGIVMKKKFDKYWDECGMALTVAIILDPRYKMKIVECVYTQMHEKFANVYIVKVRDFLVDLYFEYWNLLVVQALEILGNLLLVIILRHLQAN